ncbi:DUF3347 domain-containing protein [Flavobacterium sp. JP2137]|uniref:DUF3347 domain-containing protein n=1 Tax=Flavobacterium sp. JP2137 TaxID=3414510 RepID=UPI003D2FC610
MKKLHFIVLALWVCTQAVAAQSSIKNQKTASFSIDGKGALSKENIEKAAFTKGVSQITWDIDTQLEQLSYDTLKTNPSEILKKIALAGYDNEAYLAPLSRYEQLSTESQYVRSRLPMTAVHTTVKPPTSTAETSEIQLLITRYMAVKNAFIASDFKQVHAQALLLNQAVKNLNTSRLNKSQSTDWQTHSPALNEQVAQLSRSTQLEAARKDFDQLSKVFKDFLAAQPLDTPVYYMHCPMFLQGKGGNWLSVEKEIQNPFYGQQMLSCGSLVETLK